MLAAANREALAVALLLRTEGSDETRVIELDPRRNRSFYFWHIFIERLPEGTRYNWQVTLPGDDDEPQTVHVSLTVEHMDGLRIDRVSMRSQTTHDEQTGVER